MLARRLGIVALSLLTLVVCCGLAWWQWTRFESAGGTFQNLGYVLQWPLFGLFPAFMFYRLRKLRLQHIDRPAPVEYPEPPPLPSKRVASTVESGGDHVLAEYNRYLAELNAKDQ
jgi:hypothetical protein